MPLPKFDPYIYAPEFAGPRQMVPQAPMMPQPAAKEFGGVIVPVSMRYLPADFAFSPGFTVQDKNIFLMFPDDMAPQRMFLAWNTRVSGTSQASLSVSVHQITRDAAEREVFEPVHFVSANYGASFISTPKNLVEANFPLVVRIRHANTSDPVTTAWWETEGLELWLTIHFLSAGVSSA